MSNKQSKAALDSLKMQAANEVGVNLANGYNGDITARQAGSVGGMMVNTMIPKQQYKYHRVNRRLHNHILSTIYNVVVYIEL